MKKILFPTDFSPSADNAFIYALKIAEQLNAKVCSLHVYHRPDISDVNLPTTLKEVYDSIEFEELESYREHVPHLHKIAAANGLSHIPMENVMEEGDVLDTILKVAEREEAELIILGTKGASGLKEVFIGSVAGEVLESANCMVLAVPDEAQFDGVIDHIAITTSYQKPEEMTALQKIVDFADLFKAKVYCVNVDIENASDLNNKMDTWKKGYTGTTAVDFRVLEGDDIKESLSKFVNEEQIDILAMLSRKRSFLQELFHYSKVKQMSYHLKTPVMAIKS